MKERKWNDSSLNKDAKIASGLQTSPLGVGGVAESLQTSPLASGLGAKQSRCRPPHWLAGSGANQCFQFKKSSNEGKQFQR